MDDLRFDGQVAIVTGAGGNAGLGRAYALLLAERGANVLVNDHRVGPDGRGPLGDGPAAVVRDIVAAGGVAMANEDSVATQGGAASIVADAVRHWGRVDIVVNNAGIAPFALFEEISDRDIERVVDVHLMGTIWMCRAAWPHMKAQKSGRIVNVTSIVSLAGGTHQAIYSGAKLGVIGFTAGIALEGKPFGIAANVIMPEANTLAWQTMLGKAFSEQAEKDGKVPELVAPVAAWLAHGSCHCNGQIVAAGAGSVYEIFISRTLGSEGDPRLTPERVAACFGSAASRTGAIEFSQSDPIVVPPDFVPRAYDPTPRARV